jgi:choline-sulfatase
VLITIDTLRADRLGRGFTPNLDRLAARGLVFTNTRTAVPLTLPSHASILSGLLPTHHGVRLNGGGRFAGHPTLATILKAQGYRTAAVVGAFVLNRQFGLDAGFDTYDDNVRHDPAASTALEAERPASAVTDAALAAAASAGGAPSFLWVHYYDPHAPYVPPAAALARAGGNAYDGEVAYVDDSLGRFVAALERTPGPGGTLVVVAGDHGESLGEHGEATHGMLLYDGALRVPLIFSWLGPGDGLRHGLRAKPASLVDLAPTVLARLGIAAPAPMDGIDLNAASAAGRELYAETEYPRVAGWSPLRALVAQQWKAILGGRTQLFDVRQDAAEQHDLTRDRPAIVSGMSKRLRDIVAVASPAAPPLSDETRERLRSLGYVAPSAPPDAFATLADPADRIADWRDLEAASADLAQGRTGPALARLRDLAARNPSAQVFQTEWARALAASGRRAEALAAYRRAAERWPGDAVLLHDLAVAAREAKQPEEALRAEQAALVLVPSYAAAQNGLGLLRADAGHDAEAAEAFERAVAVDRSDPSYWTNLGNARRALGDLDRAGQAYRAALALDATWPDAANGIGVIIVQAGRPGEAVAWFEKALARDPGLVEARLNLGIACQGAGQTARAKASYEAVLRAPARFTRERDAARTLLEELAR